MSTTEPLPAEGTFASAFAAASLEVEAPSGVDTSTPPAVESGADTTATTEPTGDTFTIKVGGVDKTVTRDELINLAQQGDDYTQKTQGLAAERQRLAAAEALVTKLAKDPQGTLDELRAHYQLDTDDLGDLDPEERRVVELDQRLATIEEDQRQSAISAALDGLKTEHGDFDEAALINHAISLGTSDLNLAYRSMTYDTVYAEAQAARTMATEIADEAATTAKRDAQVVAGGSTAANTSTAAPVRGRSISELLTEALAS